MNMPTRLLDLGLVQAGGNPKLVYCQSITGGLRARYTILSHCWGPGGTPEPLQTLLTNEKAHEQRIDFSALPKNFQDAIRVTLVLGVQYLWIDSLCIVQDSGLDWEAESAKMVSYY
jgi:hypothetical protein